MSTHEPGFPVAPGNQGPVPRYILRNLNGIAEIEALLVAAERHPNPLWAKEYDQAKARVDPTSRRLFGLTADETGYVDDPALDEYENAERYGVWEDFLELMEGIDRDDVAAAWRNLGWDLWDARGQPMRCLEYFVRQIITVAAGRGGRLPDARIELNEKQEQDLEARLRAEAGQYRRTAKPEAATGTKPTVSQSRPAVWPPATNNKAGVARPRAVEVVRVKSRLTSPK